MPFAVAAGALAGVASGAAAAGGLAALGTTGALLSGAAGAATAGGALLAQKGASKTAKSMQQAQIRENEKARTMTPEQRLYFNQQMKLADLQYDVLSRGAATQADYATGIQEPLAYVGDMWLQELKTNYPQLNVSGMTQAGPGQTPSLSQFQRTAAPLPGQRPPPPPPPEEREIGIGDFMRRQRDGTLTQEDIMARQRAFEAGQLRRPPPIRQPGAPFGGRPPLPPSPPQVAPTPLDLAATQPVAAPVPAPAPSPIGLAPPAPSRGMPPPPPPGFTPPSGMATMAQVPFYNPTTGESWTAPSGGYAPPPGWVRGSPPQAAPMPQPAPSPIGLAPSQDAPMAPIEPTPVIEPALSPAERRRRQDERLGLVRDPDESPAEFRQRRREALEAEDYSAEVERASVQRRMEFDEIGRQYPSQAPAPGETAGAFRERMGQEMGPPMQPPMDTAGITGFEQPQFARPAYAAPAGVPTLPRAGAGPGTSTQTLNNAIGFITTGLTQLERGFQLTPQQNQQIEAAIDSARARAQTSAERDRAEGLRAVFDEIAPSLGLRPGDTANLDRAGRIVAEYQRQMGDVSRELAGQEAQLKLNIPLSYGQAAAQARYPQVQALTQLGTTQANIEEQARQRRLGILGGLTTLGQNLQTQRLDLARAAGGSAPSFPTGGTALPTFDPRTINYGAAGLELGEAIKDYRDRPYDVRTSSPIDLGIPRNLNIPVNLQPLPTIGGPRDQTQALGIGPYSRVTL